MEFLHSLPPARLHSSRMQPVCEIAAGRRVLHVGCTDAGLTSERLVERLLLHPMLHEAADDLWGIDVDRVGLAQLRRAGFSQVLCADVTTSDWTGALPAETEFDLVVASEVLEHLADPGVFLRGLHAIMKPGTELLVTVPNAYGLEQLVQLSRNVEAVHPDHNYWFSYHTIVELLRKCGFHTERVEVYSLQPVTFSRRAWKRWVLRKILYRRSAFWADGLIVLARLDR